MIGKIAALLRVHKVPLDLECRDYETAQVPSSSSNLIYP